MKTKTKSAARKSPRLHVYQAQDGSWRHLGRKPTKKDLEFSRA